MAGYARSGSTFLDSTLGAHPDVFSAGELTHLFDDAVDDRPCGCGETLSACPVWGHVLSDVAVQPEQGRAITRAVEHGLRPWSRRRPRLAAYGRVWSRVAASLGERVAATTIVDASKTMQFAARRPGLLATMLPNPVRLLHLTRDPRAAAWSVRKGGNPIARDRSLKPLDAWRTAATWSLANLVAERARRHGDSLHVRYEDLVTAPGATLALVGDLLGIDLSTIADRLVAGDALPVGHGIAGNRARQAGGMRLRADTDWHSAAPTSVHLAARLTGPVARRYGYLGGVDRDRSAIAGH